MTHPVDEVLPPGRLLVLAIQHVLTMYAGAVTVPLVRTLSARAGALPPVVITDASPSSSAASASSGT